MQLEDLYVKEAFRKFGIGKALFGRLGKVAQEKVWILIQGRTHSFILPTSRDAPEWTGPSSR